ncbi:MAG TPA: helix-turn-helix transcriptional regulator, partial [Actinocrinis sp.]|nr:helix-turn-helix transcriptional regulator [Actinocrinis sp.]
MGRTPRLVNPDDGPLQAFAHDLRALREKAGNPTYRALAKTAGFSASTLGEAAGGVRKPSLDVTLAFVGACGGDVEAWQDRWQELDRQLTA